AGPGARGLEDARLHSVRDRVVPVLHAPSGRATRQPLLYPPKPVSGIKSQLVAPSNCLLIFFRRSRGEGQLRDAIEHVALLRGEHVLIAPRIEYLLALVRRHLAQVADSVLHHVPAAGWQFLHALVEAACILLLLRRQVFPGFHSIQNPVLLLRRKAAELLQALPELLLALRRQAAELRVVF